MLDQLKEPTGCRRRVRLYLQTDSLDSFIPLSFLPAIALNKLLLRSKENVIVGNNTCWNKYGGEGDCTHQPRL